MEISATLYVIILHLKNSSYLKRPFSSFSCLDLFWFNAYIYTFGDQQYIGIDDPNISYQLS